MSIDRPRRVVAAWAFGPRTAAVAETVVGTTRERTANRAGIAWISAGWEPDAETIADLSCDAVPPTTGGRSWAVRHRTPDTRLTHGGKHRRGRRRDHVAVRPTLGRVVDQPHTVHVERRNGVRRDRLGCLPRKTPAVTVLRFAQHWLRPHPALRQPLSVPLAPRRDHRRTPAMLLGLADRPCPGSTSSPSQCLPT